VADVIVIGAGHNGLTVAATLARAGHAVLVLERRERIGGFCATEEFFPGFRVSSGLHSCPLLCDEVVESLGLEAHGLRRLPERLGAFAPTANNGSLMLPADRTAAHAAIAERSAADAESYLRYQAWIDRIAPLVRTIRASTPPLPGSLKRAELGRALKLGREFWRQDSKLKQEILRVGPMCGADFMREWFESELLCAMLVAPALHWSWMGPWSAGSVATLLMRAAGSSAALLAGGMGNLTDALAACAVEAGAEIRTGCPVERIEVSQGRAGGVRLAGGEQLGADVVVSGVDPKQTFFALVGPDRLAPGFAQLVRNCRTRGTTAKVHLAVGELPDFSCRPGLAPAEQHRARIHIGPELDDLERAFDGVKYGRAPERPMLELLIPSVTDPTMAPAGQHVLSLLVHHVPPQADREALGDAVVRTLAEQAPNVPASILHREVLTPDDLGRRFGVTDGHPAHLEHALDQLFFMRPMPGWAGYQTPIDKLYLCGMGVHPGGGISCRPGANAAREVLRDL